MVAKRLTGPDRFQHCRGFNRGILARAGRIGKQSATVNPERPGLYSLGFNSAGLIPYRYRPEVSGLGSRVDNFKQAEGMAAGCMIYAYPIAYGPNVCRAVLPYGLGLASLYRLDIGPGKHRA